MLGKLLGNALCFAGNLVVPHDLADRTSLPRYHRRVTEEPSRAAKQGQDGARARFSPLVGSHGRAGCRHLSRQPNVARSHFVCLEVPLNSPLETRTLIDSWLSSPGGTCPARGERELSESASTWKTLQCSSSSE